jgi:hypothetical protein
MDTQFLRQIGLFYGEEINKTFVLFSIFTHELSECIFYLIFFLDIYHILFSFLTKKSDEIEKNIFI